MENENFSLSDAVLETRASESCDLKKLSDMATELDLRNQYIDKAETELKELKKVRDELSQITIPEYMRSFGLSEIKLFNGDKVSIKEDIKPTITDFDAFAKFLEERGEADIIKLNMNFNRMPQEKQTELMSYLMGNDYDFVSDNKINYQTQAKYFRDLLGVGMDPDDLAEGIKEGRIFTPDKLENFVKLYKLSKTNIKKKN